MKFLLFLCLSLNAFAADYATYPCAQSVEPILKEWKPILPWQVQFKGGLKDQFLAAPTDVLGDWVFVMRLPDGIVVSKSNQDGRLEAAFKGAKCEKIVKSYPHPKSALKMITDHDLKKDIKTSKMSILYVWSKRMGLSEKGIAEIKLAARKLKVPVHIYEDVKLDSFELRMRSVDQHYPAILLTMNQKILPEVKYGFEKSDRYELELGQRLGLRK